MTNFYDEKILIFATFIKLIGTPCIRQTYKNQLVGDLPWKMCRLILMKQLIKTTMQHIFYVSRFLWLFIEEPDQCHTELARHCISYTITSILLFTPLLCFCCKTTPFMALKKWNYCTILFVWHTISHHQKQQKTGN